MAVRSGEPVKADSSERHKVARPITVIHNKEKRELRGWGDQWLALARLATRAGEFGGGMSSSRDQVRGIARRGPGGPDLIEEVTDHVLASTRNLSPALL